MVKLSICIPTYNRSAFLRSNLLSLFDQINDQENEVEVIISNNASTDDTDSVVAPYLHRANVTYQSQPVNLGAIKNILNVVERAKGEFCWIIGDDDFLMPGAVKNVLEVINKNSSIDFIYAKVTEIEIDEYLKYPQPFHTEMVTNNTGLQYKIIERWEKLLTPQYSIIFLGELMGSVFRRALWVSYKLEDLDEPYLSTLNTSYPHSVIFANTMIGRKAIYLETPSVLAMAGSRDWWHKLGYITLVHVKSLLALYKSRGVSLDIMMQCYDHFIKLSAPFALKFLFNSPKQDDNNVLLGKYYREMFSLNRRLLINESYKEVKKNAKHMQWHYKTRAVDYIRRLFIKSKKTDAVLNAEHIKALHIDIPNNYNINGVITFVNEGSIKIGNQFKANSGADHNMIGGDSVLRIIAAKRGAIINIGDNVGMSNCTIVAWKKVTIEDNVLIGGGVKIWDTNFHSLNPQVRTADYHLDHDIKTAPIHIKQYAFIGAGSIILKGVTIGENSVIGAGSVVVGDIPDNVIAGGNPCRVIKPL
ncbi:glycosyltransferase [Mucilaginibacter pallidiroseus]|uniref:Glycosyltransferase n=1 Tax=Mucilaginibacter pallidiroseus TaxID=2599295 RepID=A0A563U8B7_9SPHI|nr:glycosyltransferase [Mucilaginibacter pallidiroseus]TWR27566.1 glycosyltransferase [Mucilaginibacter pallidiroseus]